MSESSFLGFGQFSRPSIGLISDSFQNLSEIFESDKRSALRNIQIKPEILDSLYGLHTKLNSAEDLRSASGLEKLLLPSLNQLTEVFLDRIPTSLYVNRDFYSPEYPLGGTGSPQVKTSNVIVYNGSLQCEGVNYKANTIGESLFGNPIRQSVAMSTSRASLFNAEMDTTNVGYFKSAKYSGSIRVRKRSHVNRIFLPKTNFLKKSDVAESPTHALRVDVDNGNTGTSTPVKLLATKNTPLRIFCRMATGSIKFTFTDANAPYFYGFQIQPAQARPNTPPIEFLPVPSASQTAGSLTYTLNLDITNTGYQNLYDLYLYIYVNPEKIKGLEFSGIDIREFPDRKDLGLIGFNNLEVFKVSGGSMTILPLWLKTLKTKLKVLDLGDSGDLWRSGPMGWFDIRNPSANAIGFGQLYTGISYLTIPKKGVFLNENGNDWSDPIFRKYIRNESRIAGTDFRTFSALESLRLGDRFYGRSPRFDDVFPNLKSLDWSNFNVNRLYRYLFGSLPKIKNNGFLIDYNIYGSGAEGNISDVGTSTDHTNSNHVSRYLMRSFNIGGRYAQDHNIVGYINNPSDTNWSTWLLNTVSIDINRTGVSINLQSGQWSSLTSLDASFSGGAKFDNASSALRAPKLTGLYLYGSSTTGVMPSLGSNPATETGNLVAVNIGSCNSLSAIVDNGVNFLLPSNFAPDRALGAEHKLTGFSIGYFAPAYRFRKNDLKNLYSLTSFESVASRLTGRFPVFPTTRLYETDRKQIGVDINRSDFYDLRTLSIAPSNFYFARDIVSVVAWSCNAENGGALPPNFEGTSTTEVQVVDVNNCLESVYRSDWGVPELRGACVSDSHSGTSVSGLGISRAIPSSSADPDDAVFTLTGGSAMRQKVMVNDSVRTSATGPELARVLSVTDTSVIISSNIPNPLPNPLVFTRNTVNISEWFKSGFSETSKFRARNCRLSGTLNIRSGFGKVSDDAYSAIDFGRNMLTDCSSTTLSRIFSGGSRKVTVDLSENNLPASVVQRLISQVVDIDKLRRFTNCLIRISGNKLSSDGKYSNYTQQEIFPTSVAAGPDAVTSLFRSETFDVFSQVTVTNEGGTSETKLVTAGTTTRQVPGVFVNGAYHKTRRDKTQIVTESPLGTQFRNLSGIKFDIGFTYVAPRTSPTIVSTTYEVVTTRTQSITDSGLTSLASCPSGISGTCWRNSSNQILRLN